MEKVAYQGQTLTRWQVGNSTFLALPERGARLLNWNLTLGDGSVRDVIYWPEQADFAEIAKVRGGNPILFPFNGRTFDGTDIFHWRAADGVRRPMPLHGIARQGTFELTRLDARGFVARFLPGVRATRSITNSRSRTASTRWAWPANLRSPTSAGSPCPGARVITFTSACRGARARPARTT